MSALAGSALVPSKPMGSGPRLKSGRAASRPKLRCTARATPRASSTYLLRSFKAQDKLPGVTSGRSRRRTKGLTTTAVLLAEKIGDCYVLPAAKGKRAMGIVHFLGGAFVGAAPQLAYGLLMQIMAEKGYTVIATPYKLTFNHKECATKVHEAFNETISQMRAEGREDAAPSNTRIFGVGHSNGSLLHLLIGSMYIVPNISNVLISYNNKQVSDAIPIPGLLDALRPAVNELNLQVEGGSGSAPVAAAPWLPPTGLLDAYTTASLEPVGEQVEDVLREVGSGVTDFTPSPSESRNIVRESYNVPSTLLVQFENDGIDETKEMSGILGAKYPSGTRVLKLPGTHVTPLGLDYDIEDYKAFPPAYLSAVATKAAVQFDQRRLAARILSWMGR